MSHMIYEDYRKSALKHLKTCEYMIENLHRINDIDSLDGLTKSEWKRHVLHNIYYLCGYALEGVINYCIYKIAYNTIRQNTDISLLNEYTGWSTFDNRGNRRQCAICFRIPVNKLNNSWYQYLISSHDYCENKEFIIKKIGIRASSILPSRSNRSINKTIELFYSWQVRFRYHSDTTHFIPNSTLVFSEDEIIDFFIFIREEIYSKLPLVC